MLYGGPVRAGDIDDAPAGEQNVVPRYGEWMTVVLRVSN